MPNVTDDYKRVHPPTRTALRQWFATNAADSPGVWVVMWKQASGRTGPSYVDIVEEALCVGWIDSRKISLDDHRSAQLVTPRKPRSPWADSNKERVRRLIDERKMRPAGLAVIEEAKRNGTWDATPRIDPAELPDDLARALSKNATTQKHWDAFPPSVRKQFIGWVVTAVKPETRMRRIERTVGQAKQNDQTL
ncbi:MAG: hypothetical protein DWI58_10860 [Chloroflexi bacterium]|nr:MAG: hypothetical protein DWI58_10860 [Chloroflexota bacterium]